MDGLACPPFQAVLGLPLIKTCFFLAELLAGRGGSMSASERPACLPFCLPTASRAELTTWLCSPARGGRGWTSRGRLPLPVFRKTPALCVAGDGARLRWQRVHIRG